MTKSGSRLGGSRAGLAFGACGALALASMLGCSSGSSGPPSPVADPVGSGGGTGASASGGATTAIAPGTGGSPGSGGTTGIVGGGPSDAGRSDDLGPPPPPASGTDAGPGGAGAGGRSSPAGTGGRQGAGGSSGAGGPTDAGGRPDAATGAPSDAGRPGATDAGSPSRFTVYLAGDSTVSQYVLDPADPKSWAGWGQMLQTHYDSQVVTVSDKAVGGMTARHFILAGDLAAILNVLKAGDYLLVQFGTNDSNTTATFTLNGTTYPYFADASTDFKTYLQQYIDGARAKNAIPVLVTPPPRNSAYCGGGRSLSNYGQAMIELGAADKVPVVDLGLKTWTYLNPICPKPASGTTETFFKVTGTVIDGTHFQENGARIMAGFVADGLGEDSLGLDAFRIN